MGFLSRLQSPSWRADTPPPHSGFWYQNPGLLSETGMWVDDKAALTISAFWKGVRILSENIASFQAHVRERVDDRGVTWDRAARRHPVDYAIARRANRLQTAFEFWELMMAALVLRGNAFARILPGPRGFCDQLVPIHPDRVQVARLPNGEVQYTIRRPNAKPEIRGDSDILHFRGLGFDGVTGVSVIEYGVQSIGVMLASERYTQRFFKAGATAALAAIFKDPADEESRANMRQSIQEYLLGLENAHGVFVADEDVKLESIGINPQEAQLLELRQFSVEVVAHWLNLPPGILGPANEPTHASSVQFRQDLADLSFRGWTERLESRVDTDLLAGEPGTDAEDRFFAKFNMNALLRGNAVERSQIHTSGIKSGWKTRNEARRDEDLEPIPGLDEPLTPTFLPGTNADPDRKAVFTGTALRALRDATTLVRQEVRAITRAAGTYAADGAGWEAWVREFYADHAGRVAQTLRLPLPVAREYAARQGLKVTTRSAAETADWEWTVAPALAELALSREQVVVPEEAA